MGRWRAVAMVVAGLSAFGLPFLGSVVPAGAANFVAGGSSNLSFVTLSGQHVTCTVADSAVHNTDNPDDYYVTLTGTTAPSGDPACAAYLALTISFEDKAGVVHETHASNGSTPEPIHGLFLNASDTYSPVSTSVFAQFPECDASRSTACTVLVSASPK